MKLQRGHIATSLVLLSTALHVSTCAAIRHAPERRAAGGNLNKMSFGSIEKLQPEDDPSQAFERSGGMAPYMQKSEGRGRQLTSNTTNLFASGKAQQHVSMPLFSDQLKNILQNEQADLEEDDQRQEESIVDDDDNDNRMQRLEQ